MPQAKAGVPHTTPCPPPGIYGIACRKAWKCARGRGWRRWKASGARPAPGSRSTHESGVWNQDVARSGWTRKGIGASADSRDPVGDTEWPDDPITRNVESSSLCGRAVALDRTRRVPLRLSPLVRPQGAPPDWIVQALPSSEAVSRRLTATAPPRRCLGFPIAVATGLRRLQARSAI